MIRSPAALLALFTALNLLNYLDRMVLSAVLPRIEEQLHISHAQGGLLATVFLVGYFATSPIFGWLGDRVPRKGLIALGVLVWSGATIASGLVTGLGALVLARVFVGLGEASYATLAPTIIDDVTPPERKGRALAIFYIATPLGSALGYLLGGLIEHRWGWRSAFYVAGGPGIVLALVCLLVAEPTRKVSEEKPAVLRDLGRLLRSDLYRKGVLGYCAYTAAIGGFSFWAPTFLYTRYGLPLGKANTIFGGILVIGGAIGTLIGGRLADRAAASVAEGRAQAAPVADPNDGLPYRDESPDVIAARVREDERSRVRSLLRVCAMGSAFGAPLAMFAFLSPSWPLFFAVVFFAIVFLFLNTSPINAVILQSVPSELRASAMALSIFSIHMFGDLWSPPLVGLLSDVMPMRLALMFLPLSIATSAVVWWSRRPAQAG